MNDRLVVNPKKRSLIFENQRMLEFRCQTDAAEGTPLNRDVLRTGAGVSSLGIGTSRAGTVSYASVAAGDGAGVGLNVAVLG